MTVNVVGVIDAGSMGPLNVALSLVLVATLVAARAGLTELTLWAGAGAAPWFEELLPQPATHSASPQVSDALTSSFEASCL